MLCEKDQYWMRKALKLAEKAADFGEVPVGAIIVKNDELVAEGWNQPISAIDPSAHAEVIAVRAAATKLNNYRIPGATLYVTLEPCTMCFGVLVHARIERLVFGAMEPKSGVICSQAQLADAKFFNHKVEYRGGVLEAECAALLSNFFKKRREKNQ